MNIGIVTTGNDGGAGSVSRAYMDALQKQGNSVQIYARGGRYYPFGDPLWDLPNVASGMRYVPLGRVSRYMSDNHNCFLP